MPRRPTHNVAGGSSFLILGWQELACRLYRARWARASSFSDNVPMPSTTLSPTPVECTGGPLSAVDTDLLIIPWFQEDGPGALAGNNAIDPATGGEIARALTSKEFQAKPFELLLTAITDRSWRARRVALIGGGSGEQGSDLIRKLATAAGLAARQKRVAR